MVRLILMAFIFNFCNALTGQLTVNVNGGLNLSNFSYRLFGDEVYRANQKYLKFTPLYNAGIGVDYRINRITLESGIGIATRGARDYEASFFEKGYYVIEHGFIELPMMISYGFVKNRLHGGGGFLVSCRAGSNTRYQAYENKFFEVDSRLFIRFDFNKRLSSNVSYTFGNLDKYLFGVEDNFLHHVFAFNLKYNFLIFK